MLNEYEIPTVEDLALADSLEESAGAGDQLGWDEMV